MTIANGTCMSFRNQPKAHFGLPWENRRKCTWMKRGFNACQSYHSMYPSTFNRFSVIQPVNSEVRHFSTFWPPLAPGYAPGTVAVNVTWIQGKEDSMVVKCIAAYTHLSSTVYEL